MPLFLDILRKYRDLGRNFMDYKTSEVLEFIEENDVKFIKLAFCDIFGNQKNITIMPTELKRAFYEGVSSDASAVTGFMKVESFAI